MCDQLYTAQKLQMYMVCRVCMSHMQSLPAWVFFCLWLSLHRDGVFEYIEEFPVKLLRKFCEVTGIEVGDRRVVVVLLQYGAGFHGPEEDVFRVDRAAADPEYAEYSNFLHPVIHYFKEIPKG